MIPFFDAVEVGFDASEFPQLFEEDKLCHAIFNEFYNYQISGKDPSALKPAIFASQFYLRENDKQLLEPKINQWKRQTVDNKTHINSELIQEQDFRGFSLLEIAVKSGFLLELSILIEAGIDVNQTFTDQQITLLYAAVERDYSIDTVNALIKAGADVNKAVIGRESPLACALRRSNIDVVNALIKAGAEVNKRRKGGRRLLRKAILKQHLEIADLLLESGARGSLVMEDSDGFSLLEDDLIDNNIERARFLIKHGQTVELDAKYNKRETILERAIRKGHTEVVQLFINNFIEEPLEPVIVLGRPFPADLVAGYNQGRSLLEKFEFKATMLARVLLI